jgi:hypothetical protein
MRTVQLNYSVMLRSFGFIIGLIVVAATLTEVLLFADRQNGAKTIRDCTAIVERDDRLSCFDTVTHQVPTWPAKGANAPRLN